MWHPSLDMVGMATPTPSPEDGGSLGSLKTELVREGLLTGAMALHLVEGGSHVVATLGGEPKGREIPQPLSFLQSPLLKPNTRGQARELADGVHVALGLKVRHKREGSVGGGPWKMSNSVTQGRGLS